MRPVRLLVRLRSAANLTATTVEHEAARQQAGTGQAEQAEFTGTGVCERPGGHGAVVARVVCVVLVVRYVMRHVVRYVVRYVMRHMVRRGLVTGRRRLVTGRRRPVTGRRRLMARR